jgi:hypothetical protein
MSTGYHGWLPWMSAVILFPERWVSKSSSLDFYFEIFWKTSKISDIFQNFTKNTRCFWQVSNYNAVNIDITQLPSFDDLPLLNSLDLSNNSFSGAAPLLIDTYVTYYDVSNNQLSDASNSEFNICAGKNFLGKFRYFHNFIFKCFIFGHMIELDFMLLFLDLWYHVWYHNDVWQIHIATWVAILWLFLMK